ncbi:MAG: ParB/RepB/Spo0J family partition protein [Rhodospirillaceae bacterium]|nr:ParB/RepB/Spo0J family partition protein [Rhodospirillaceae bacterium]
MIQGETRRRGLGRGLEALLGGDDYAAAPDGTPDGRPDAPGMPAGPDRPGPGIQRLPIGDLRTGKFQPRRRFDEDELAALAASIGEKGVLQPVLVRRHPEEAGCWELVAGERRWLAAQRAGLREIPAVVHDLSDKETLEAAIVENVQRQDLTPLEEAGGYRRLIAEFGYTQEALAKIVGKSRSHVANNLRLLNLSDGAKALLDSGALSAGHARALLAAADPDALAEKIAADGLSVRQAEALARNARVGTARARNNDRRGPPDRPAGRAAASAGKDADTLALERELEARLGLKVAIDHKGPGGQVGIRYASLEQLDDLLARLLGKP